MKIKFKKEYPNDDATYMDIILDFIEYLGPAHFDYEIDEYDLLGIVWAARMKKLAPLINDTEHENKPAMSMFRHCAQMWIANKELGREMKEDYIKVLGALMPKERDLSEKAEDIILNEIGGKMK